MRADALRMHAPKYPHPTTLYGRIISFIFVLENMAMPYVEKLLSRSHRCSMGEIETLNDSRDIARVGLDGIFHRRAFVSLRGHRLAGKDQLASLLVG